jgi:hypothetical protein
MASREWEILRCDLTLPHIKLLLLLLPEISNLNCFLRSHVSTSFILMYTKILLPLLKLSADQKSQRLYSVQC